MKEQLLRPTRGVGSQDVAGAGRERWPRWAALAVVYGAVLLLLNAPLARPGVRYGAIHNVQIAEAWAWWDGRLDLQERLWDTALYDGRVFSHFPILFTLVAAATVPFFGGVPHALLVLLFLVPIPLLALDLFHKRTGSPTLSTWGTVGLIAGTSLWPVLNRAIGSASPYYVNHSFAVIGTLVLLNELFGRRRIWAGGLGLLIASWSRPLCLAYVVPLAWMALSGRIGPGLRRRAMVLLTSVAVVVGVLLTFNSLRFGHPLESGYGLIYEGREDDSFARDAREHGLFSLAFIPRNLYYTNLGLPSFGTIEVAGQTKPYVKPNDMGTGIWWTTPLLLWVLIDLRALLRDPAARVLLLSVGAIVAALMLFHATGHVQMGYNRFSLDFVPALLALGAARCFAGRRRGISVAMIGWSVVYFRFLI